MRRKGQVSQSREISGLLALLAAGAALYAMSPTMGAQMAEFMREVFRADISARADLGGNHVLHDLMYKALKIATVIALPVCLSGFCLGVLGSVAQIGAIFSSDPLTPDLKKIDPIQGLKRMLSVRQILEGMRLFAKAAVVGAVAYALVKSEILSSPAYLFSEPVAFIGAYARSSKFIFLALVGVLAVFAGIDFLMQRREWSKKVRLTKQEAKQEFKEREGDPQIKARVRAIQRETARKRMMQAVRTADVIVTNPTHIAVALVYDKEKMGAPKVVAKGADFLAQKIKQIASDAGVPLVENVPLARTLYKTCKVGQSIPRALYQAVAEVLAYVYRLKNRRL